jgi:hypothetical protein
MLEPQSPQTLDETSYRLNGDFTLNPLSLLLFQSFFDALALKHKLPNEILEMEGMSGRKYRYFINNLISNMTQPCYLEVGSWMGSTACAAIYGNSVTITCVDNWSQFGGPKTEFLENISKNLNSNVNLKFIENDFRKVDFSQLGTVFNVYLYDGPHEERDQHDGIVIAQPALSNTYVLIVDDWNWPAVRSGTYQALANLKATTICSIEILTNQYNCHPKIAFKDSEWHNGYFFAVIQKAE